MGNGYSNIQNCKFFPSEKPYKFKTNTCWVKSIFTLRDLIRTRWLKPLWIDNQNAISNCVSRKTHAQLETDVKMAFVCMIGRLREPELHSTSDLFWKWTFITLKMPSIPWRQNLHWQLRGILLNLGQERLNYMKCWATQTRNLYKFTPKTRHLCIERAWEIQREFSGITFNGQFLHIFNLRVNVYSLKNTFSGLSLNIFFSIIKLLYIR